MRRAWAWLLGAALAIGGCEGRRAGTETGNPEIIVTAMLSVHEYGTSQTSDLHFRIMGMEYSTVLPSGATDSGRCWSRPGGTEANFASLGPPPLPDTALEDLGPWEHADIVLRVSDVPAGIPGSADIETWSSPRYAKFDLFTEDGRRKVLFEMPQGTEYRLRFGKEETESWRFLDTMYIPFFFHAQIWTDTLRAMPGLVPRLDGRGAPFLLLSPGENAAGWNALKAKLPKSFYADSVIVR